jgi:hypothetical protein
LVSRASRTDSQTDNIKLANHIKKFRSKYKNFLTAESTLVYTCNFAFEQQSAMKGFGKTLMLMNRIDIHFRPIGGGPASWQSCAGLSGEGYGLVSLALGRFAVGGNLPAQPESGKGLTIKNRLYIQV